MSTVDDAEVIQGGPSPGIDPSANSGRRGGRVNRNTVLVLGFIFAGVVSIGFGILIVGFQKGNTVSFTPPASAATPKPTAVIATSDDVAHDVRVAKANPAPGETALPNPEASSTNPAGAPPTPAPVATPTLAERVQAFREGRALAMEVRHFDDADKARDGSAMVAGGTTAAVSAPPLTPAGDGTSQPPAPPSPPSDSITESATPQPGSGVASTFAIREGDFVEVILQPNIDSDRRGEVTFYFTRDVTDSDTGSLVLIPRGTPAVARVLAASVNDRVVALAPEKLRLNGRWVAIPGVGQDANGDNGISAHVNDHRGPLFVLSALAGGLAGLTASSPTSNSGVVIGATSRPPVLQEILGGIGTGTLNAANQLVAEIATRPPSLTVRHATRARFQVATDIELPPYCDHKIPLSRECHAISYLNQSEGKLK